MKTISGISIQFLYLFFSKLSAQAPGDADSFCTSVNGSVTPLSYPPNTRVLMDSYHYINLLSSSSVPAWQQVDVDNIVDSNGQNTTWFQAGSLACRRTVSACFFANGIQNNWLITQHINRVVNGSLLPQVSVQIEFQLSGCTSGCQQSFLLQVWETSTIDRDAARVTSNYRRVFRIAPTFETRNIAQNASLPINFQSPTATGFYIAIVDENTCISITRVIVLYHVCPEMNLDLIKYPGTLSPPINEPQPNLVDGECVDGASGELQGRNPRLSCLQGGEWGEVQEGTGCACNSGYMYVLENDTCIRCPKNHFSSQFNNFTCQPCPANSQSEGGAGICDCFLGYFRSPETSIDEPCSRVVTEATTESNMSYPDTTSTEKTQSQTNGIVKAVPSTTLYLFLAVTLLMCAFKFLVF